MGKQNKNSVRKPAKKVSKPGEAKIRQLHTGVRGLDEIICGGLPEFSFNIIAGAPGSGKTTLAHQIVFANATPQKPALYFTVLGEPAIKMLRYQQQYSFFDSGKVGKAVRFVNLSDVIMEKDLGGVLEEIIKEVQAANPSIVVVDSFRTVVRKALGGTSEVRTASVYPAPGPIFDQLGSHHLFDRGIYRGGNARQSLVHRLRRPFLAHPACSKKFRGAEIASRETSRAGFSAGVAHHPY